MEASDAFGSGIEVGDDPFAGTDFGDFGEGGEEPQSNGSGEATAELPVVDKEGNRVAAEDPTSPVASVGPTEPDPTTPQSGDQAAPPAATDAPGADERALETEGRGGDPTPAGSQPSAESTEAGSAGVSSAATESVPEATPEPAGDSSSGGSTATAPDAEDPTGVPSAEPAGSNGSTEAASEEAPPPEERQIGGRTTHRRYIVLRLEGPGKFSQVAWHVDADGKMVPKGTSGSRRQTVALARGTEEALRLGYAACGGPQDGLTLVAVAALHFQPKKIKPLPPEPDKVRLQIS